MRYRYRLVAAEIIFEGRERTVFGIALQDNHARRHQMQIANITTESHALAQLVARMNRSELSKVHLFEAIEDFLLTEHR